MMIGSDWPVCTLAGDYNYVTGIITGYISEMSEDIRGKILGINCIEFYGLDVR